MALFAIYVRPKFCSNFNIFEQNKNRDEEKK